MAIPLNDAQIVSMPLFVNRFVLARSFRFGELARLSRILSLSPTCSTRSNRWRNSIPRSILAHVWTGWNGYRSVGTLSVHSSDSNSSQLALLTTTSSFLIKTRYIHFPEKYFNRPPYYGSFKKALSVHIDPLKPDASIDNVRRSNVTLLEWETSLSFIQVDYTADSEGEWEEPCKDGEELRSDAEDLSDSEAVDSDSDSDSFIVPHGHLSDDELNEDEQQQVENVSFLMASKAVVLSAVHLDETSAWSGEISRLGQESRSKKSATRTETHLRLYSRSHLGGESEVGIINVSQSIPSQFSILSRWRSDDRLDSSLENSRSQRMFPSCGRGRDHRWISSERREN